MNPQEILDELLNAEFKEVKDKYGHIKIIWKPRQDKKRWWVRLLEVLSIIDREEAVTWVIFSPRRGFENKIYLNTLHEITLLSDDNFLRQALRHECLHLLMGGFASREAFFNEAKKRGIIAEKNQY